MPGPERAEADPMTDGPATDTDRHVRIYEVGPRDGLQNEAT